MIKFYLRTFGIPQEVVECTNTRSSVQFEIPLIVPLPTTFPSTIHRVNDRSFNAVSNTRNSPSTPSIGLAVAPYAVFRSIKLSSSRGQPSCSNIIQYTSRGFVGSNV